LFCLIEFSFLFFFFFSNCIFEFFNVILYLLTATHSPAQALADDKEQAASRSMFLKALCGFMNQTHKDEARVGHAPHTHAIPSPSLTAKWSDLGYVPEDVEMYGFLPFAHLHAGFTPNVCSSLTVVGAVDQTNHRQVCCVVLCLYHCNQL
jgi:hypothetical protein